MLKVQKIFSLAFFGVVLTLLACSSSANGEAETQGKFKCSQTPCANTPTGEDPSTTILAEEARREKLLREGADDKARWRSIRLYSDSKEPDELTMPLVASAKFTMQLIPRSGVLRFSWPGGDVAFRVASGLGSKGDVCPEYYLKVLDASPDHAVMKKICPQYEYAANRFHMSAEYFLFDVRSSMMRSFWFAASSVKGSPFPDAKPSIELTKLPKGYKFDWAGMFPNDNSPEKMTISNSYIREDGPKGICLVCTNLLPGAENGREDEMCEGRELDRVGKSGQ